jgi:hypothetical protein
VIPPGHPLHGLDLPVWGRLRLRGADTVVLVLPDGSKTRVPAAWTSERGRTGRAPVSLTPDATKNRRRNRQSQYITAGRVMYRRWL